MNSRVDYIVNLIDSCIKANFYVKGTKFYGLCRQDYRHGKKIPVSYKGNDQNEFVGFDDKYDLSLYHRITIPSSVIRDDTKGFGNSSLLTEETTLRVVAFGTSTKIKAGEDLNYKISEDITSLLAIKFSNSNLSTLQALSCFIDISAKELDKKKVWADELDIPYAAVPENILFYVEYRIRIKYLESCKNITCSSIDDEEENEPAESCVVCARNSISVQNNPNLQYNPDTGIFSFTDGSGSQSLQSVLGYGNATGGHDIVMSNGDFITSVNGYSVLNFNSGTNAILSVQDGVNGSNITVLPDIIQLAPFDYIFLAGDTRIQNGNFISSYDSLSRLDLGGGANYIAWTPDSGIGAATQFYLDDNELDIYNQYGSLSFASFGISLSDANGQFRTTTAGIAANSRGVQMNNSLMYLYHATKIDFDSPIYNFNQATALAIPYFDSSKNMVASWMSQGSNGISFSGGKGITNNSNVLVYDPNNGLFYNPTTGLKKADVFQGQLFNAGSAKLSIDWSLRHLVWTDGLTVKLDWSSGTGNLNVPYATANTVMVFNSAKDIISSGVTVTTLNYLDATSSVQTQLNSKEPSISAGTTSQYWRGDKSFQTLDTSVVTENGNLYWTNARTISSVLTGYSSGAGTISASDSILSAIQKLNGNIGLVSGAVVYQGLWNANTNSPALVSGVGTKGYMYKVSVAGATSIDGISQWNVGDSIIFDGTTWDKLDGVANEVLSVNGLVGAVALTGTSNRITISAGNVFDISSSYVGQSSITTLGTIATGTWNASVVSSTYGGTGVNNAGRTLTINTSNGVIDFTSAVTLTVAGTASVIGTNTGDQTSVSGNAGTATILQTARNINGVSFNGSANITVYADPLASIAAGSIVAYNALATASAITSTSGLKVLINNAGTISWGASTGTGNNVFDTSPTLVTPILGVASATSLAVTGTGGNGFATFLTQSSQATYGGSGFVLYANSSGRMAWRRQSDTYERSFASTLTADRVYTFPDKSMTFCDNGDLTTALSAYREIRFFTVTFGAANAAGTYSCTGTGTIVSGTASATIPAMIYIQSSDYPAVNGLNPKLKILVNFATNHTAPTTTHTFGLYPMTTPASSGGVGVRGWNFGTVVSGSNGAVVTTPAADTVTVASSSSFTLPSDGLYGVCVVQTGTIAALAFVECIIQLQVHWE